MAILSRVALENFGCFPQLDVPLSPLTVLVGRNDAGKTTFLKAILAQRAAASADEHSNIAASLNMPRLLWAGANPPAEACTITLHGTALLAPDKRAESAFKLDARISPSQDDKHYQLKSQDIEIGGMHRWHWDSMQLDMPDTGASLRPYYAWDLRSVLYFEQAGRYLQSLARELLGIRLVRLSPDALRQPSPPAHSEDVPELAENGAGLPTLLSVLAGAERERIAAIEAQFQKAVPTLAGFRILPTPQGNHRLVFKLAGNMGQLEASQVSDGALLFLGFLSLLYHPNPPSMLLVEEPETGVHPGRLRNIVRLLKTLSVPADDRPAVQILVTTHSPYLLDEMSPEEVLVFRRDDSGAADAIRMDSIPDIDERLSDYKLGELWTAYEEDCLYELSSRPPARAASSPLPMISAARSAPSTACPPSRTELPHIAVHPR